MSMMSEKPGHTVHVHLPAALCDLFPGSVRHVDVTASSVADVIAALERHWPGMADRLRDSRPSIRKHISIMVDGERLTYRDRLAAGADVWVLTAISGG
jgi:sulfur-carrier protein